MIDSSSSRSPSISASQRMLTRSSAGRRPAVGDDAELELAEREHGFEPGLRDLLRRIARRGSDQVVGPAQEVGVRLGREAEHVGDEQERQRRGDVPHEVALALGCDPIDDLGADTTDRRLVLAHPARCEPAAHQLPPPRMLGRVHRDHHRKMVTVRPGRAVARERSRILLDREHVVVTGQRPDLVLRVPVRRRVLAHPRPVRERLARIPTSVEEVEVAGRHWFSLLARLHVRGSASYAIRLDIFQGAEVHRRDGLPLRRRAACTSRRDPCVVSAALRARGESRIAKPDRRIRSPGARWPTWASSACSYRASAAGPVAASSKPPSPSSNSVPTSPPAPCSGRRSLHPCCPTRAPARSASPASTTRRAIHMSSNMRPSPMSSSSSATAVSRRSPRRRSANHSTASHSIR